MKTVLIVDDETEILDHVGHFLADEGYEVMTADTGKSGRELLITKKPDLLLLDVKLPDVSGLTLLEVSKKMSPRTKVIVNTGYVDQEMIDMAERLGRDAFMQKPFNLLELKEELEKLFEDSASQHD